MESQSNQESRVKKTLLNARVNLIFYFLTLALSFFSRKIFLNCLGTDFVGLTGTLQNLLGFLNLAELGVGVAIGYVLYRPLFEHDQEKINEIISVMGYLYRRIGFVILGAGCLLACFLPFIFPISDVGFSLPLIYFAYFSFLTSSLIGYFVNYRQNLLGADQRNYVVTAYFQSANIVKTVIQMAVAYYTANLYLWVTIELTFGIIYSFILNWKINQTYPWLHTEIRQGHMLFRRYPEVMKYTKQLFVHKIGGFFQLQFIPFIIYAFVSLNEVAFYGNYTLITIKFETLIESLLGSSRAGIGNLIAEGDKRKIISIYWSLMAIRFFVIGVVIFALYKLLPPFIFLWLGPQYILPNLVFVFLLINTFIGLLRGNTEYFNFGYGLFSDVWAPLAESGLCCIVAIVGGYFYGLPGIIFGSTFSLIVIVGIWKPYLLFSKGFKLPIIKYWLSFIKYVAILLVSSMVTELAVYRFEKKYPATESWLYWMYNGLIDVSILSIISFGLMYTCTNGMKTFVNKIIVVNKIKNKW